VETTAFFCSSGSTCFHLAENRLQHPVIAERTKLLICCGSARVSFGCVIIVFLPVFRWISRKRPDGGILASRERGRINAFVKNRVRQPNGRLSLFSVNEKQPVRFRERKKSRVSWEFLASKELLDWNEFNCRNLVQKIN